MDYQLTKEWSTITDPSPTTRDTFRRRRLHEPGRVPLVASPVAVGEVPRPLQAGVGAGRSHLRIPQITEPYWGTDPRTG
jgi:hypothetical protein